MYTPESAGVAAGTATRTVSCARAADGASSDSAARVRRIRRALRLGALSGSLRLATSPVPGEVECRGACAMLHAQRHRCCSPLLPAVREKGPGDEGPYLIAPA